MNRFSVVVAMFAFVLALPGAARGQITVGGNGSNTTDNTQYTGNQTLTKVGTNEVKLTNTASSFTGDITVTSGTLAGQGSAGGDNPGTSVFGAPGSGRLITIQSGATLNMIGSDVLGTAATTNQRTIVIENGGVVLSTGALSVLGPITLNGGTLRGNGGINFSSVYNATYQLNGTITTGGTSMSTFDQAAGTTDNNFYLSNAGSRITTFNVADAATGTDLLVSVLLGDGWGGGDSSLVKSGAGTMTLAAANAYEGSTTISAGTLQIGNGGTAGSIVGTSAITNNASLVVNRSNAITLANAISGTGSLTNIGGGTLTLSSANTFSGLTRATAGSIALGNTSALAGSTLDLDGTDTGSVAFSVGGVQTYLLGGLTGSRDLANGGNTLSIGGNGQSTTYSGGLSGAGGVIKTGAGTMTLTGSNSHSGGTQINAGVIAVGSAGALGTSGAISFGGGTLRYSSANTTDYSSRFSTGANQTFSIDTNGQDVSFGTGLTSSGGSLVKLGTGRLVLAQNSNYSGSTTISSGTLQVGDGGSAGSLGSGNIVNNAALLFNRTGTTTVASTISGTGTVVQTGTGTLVISAVNSYTGGTRVESGIVRFTQALGVANNAANVFTVNSGTVQFTVSDIFGVNETVVVTPLVVNAGGLIDNQGGFNRLGPVALNGGELRGTGVASGLSISLTGVTVNGGSTTSLISGTGMALGAGTDVANVVFDVADGAAANDLLVTAGLINGPGVPWPGQKTSSFTKTGAGRMTLAGDNTYTGSTTISAGTLQVGDGGATGTLPSGAVTNNASLLFNRSGSLTVASAISGTGSVEQVGPGITSLTSNSNTYSGATLITSGTLQVGDGGSTGTLGSGPVTLAGATLAFNRNNAVTISSAISGTGTLVQRGSGVTTVTASNTYVGATLISSGTLQLGSGGTTGSIGTGPLTNNGAFSINRSDALTFATDIAGTGVLIQAGSGTTTLTGSNSHTGGTRINLGVLTAGSADALGSTGTISFGGGTLRYSPANTADYSSRFSTAASQGFSIDTNGESVTFASGLPSSGGSLTKYGAGQLTLAQDSTYNGTTTVATGTLQVGNGGSAGSLGSGAITNNGTIVFNRSDAALTYSANIAGTGGVTYRGTGVTTVNTYSTYTGPTIVEAGTVTAASANTTANPSNGALGANGNDKFVYVKPGATIQFVASDILGNHITTNQRTFVIENGGTLISGTALTPLYNVTLQGGTLIGAGGINLGPSGVGVYQMNGTITATGTARSQIVASGTSTNNLLLLNAAGSNITTFDVADVTSQGDGTDLLVDMAMENAWGGASAGLTKTGLGTMTVTRGSTYTGTTTISAGTFQVGDGGATGSLPSGSVVNNAALLFNRSGSLTVAAAISGTGSVEQVGPGITSLTSNSNTYSGPTRISSGTLQVGDGGSTGTLGSGPVTLAGATLAVNRNNAFTISLPISGTGTLVQRGSGVTTVTASNTYVGSTLISSGTLQMGSGGTTGSLGTGPLTNNAVFSINRSDALTFADDMAGSGVLIQAGSGTSTLTGSNSYTGGTRINLGVLTAGSADALGSSGTISFGGGTLRYSSANTADYSGRFSTAASQGFSIDTNGESVTFATGLTSSGGSLTKYGAGQLTLAQDSNYNGTTLVATGTLQVGNGGSAGSLGSGAITSNGMIVFNRSDAALTYSANIAGTGGVTYRGTGVTTVNTYSTYTGPTVVEAGTVIAGSQNLVTNPTNGALGANGNDKFVYVKSGATLKFISSDILGAHLTTNQRTMVIENGGTLISGTALTPLYNVTLQGGTLVGAGGINYRPTEIGVYQMNGTITATGTAGSQIVDSGTGANNRLLLNATGSGITTFDVADATSQGDGTDLLVDMVIDDAWSGTSSGLTKTGPGTMTIARDSLYNGPTTVSSGTLQVGNGGTTGSLGTGAITDNGMIVFNRGDAALTYAAPIAGTGAVTYRGTGVTTVTAFSTYTGPTIIEAGRVIASSTNTVTNPSNGALGANGNDKFVYVKSGATLEFAASDILGNHVTTNQRTFVVENGGTLVSGTALTPLFNVTLQGGSLVGAGGINLGVSGIGVYQMNGTITATGTARSQIVDSGTGVNNLLLLSATGSNITTFDVADVTSQGDGTDLLVDMTMENAWGGATAGLTKTGLGTMTLTRDSIYTGVTTISAGTLQIGIGGTTGSLSASTPLVNNATLAFNRSDLVTFGKTIPGTGAVVQRGSGTTTLTGTNTYSGGTRIDAGVLGLGSAGAIGSSGTISFAGGTLQYSAINTTDYSARFSTAAGQPVSIDTNGQDVTFAAGLASSGGTLAKRGAGNLIMAGTSSYTGVTSVVAGRLSVNGTLGATSVAVLAAAELGGSGGIGGPVSVAAGGTLSPGNSIASLATGTATFAAASTFAYEVDSSLLSSLGTAADLLVVSGNLTLDPANGTLLTFTDITSGTVQPFVENTTTFAMINYTGVWNGGLFSYNGTPLADGSRFSVGSQEWEIDYNASAGGANFTADYLSSSSFVTVTAVPEPAALTLAGIAAVVGLIARFRKRAAA